MGESTVDDLMVEVSSVRNLNTYHVEPLPRPAGQRRVGYDSYLPRRQGNTTNRRPTLIETQSPKAEMPMVPVVSRAHP